MKITVEFDTEEEFKARIKNPRGTKNQDEPETGAGQPATGNAPTPLMPTQQHAGFTGPTGGFAPPNGGPAFPGASAPTADPAIMSLAQRINAKLDGMIAAGQNVDSALNWFRGQAGSEAANATLDQIKNHFMHKLPMVTLENIAKSMNA